MATYAIGDIQGCLNELLKLLEYIQFDPLHDQIWFAGDLVNRGHDSLGVLRLVKSLGDAAVVVLGNHDLHLLAADAGHKKIDKNNELYQVFEADDRQELITWLKHQPLVYASEKHNALLVHAGIPPIWDADEALARAAEVEQVLKGNNCDSFLKAMYGNQPDIWNSKLKGNARLRLITNYFTRMRFCTKKGRLEFHSKASAAEAPKGFAPWFSFKQHKCESHRVIFGHWAALMGETQSTRFIGVDTGCVWGGKMTAYRLDDQQFFSVEAISP